MRNRVWAPLAGATLAFGLAFSSAAHAGRDRTWVTAAGVVTQNDIGNQLLSGGGGLISAGHTFGPLALQLEYSMEVLAGASDEPARGLLHRGGVAVRWPWWRLGDGSPGYMDLALECGVGRTFASFTGGDVLERNDVLAGLSTQMLVNVGGNKHPRDLGIALGLRWRFAELPAGAAQLAPGCETGCAPQVDATLMFYGGLTWGL